MATSALLLPDMEGVIHDPLVRSTVTRESHLLFFHVYFPDYATYEIAPFQRELFRITEDESIPLAVITAFRGSAKSTLVTLSYTLWSILGRQRKKFVLIVSQTQEQARLHFKNIKAELESNPVLRADLGPFQEDEWNVNTLVIPKYDARITIASTEQSIRGIRHGSHRPDLIILDDIEDSNSVKTREGRDKTYGWFTSEVVPLGDKQTRIVVVGNLLHEDSLLMRLKKEIGEGIRSGIYREYPVVNDEGIIAWPGKYPDTASIEAEQRRVGNRFSWHREYLLKIIDDQEAVVSRDMLHYYRTVPKPLRDESAFFAIGVDLAFSEKQQADFTAMVSAQVIGSGDRRKVYILPHPVNDKIQLSQIIDRIQVLVMALGGRYSSRVYIEEVMLQGYLVQQLRDLNFRAEGFKVRGMDKRTRLIMTTNLIQNGTVLFPEAGAEALITQMLGFGTEKHDDLVDAFTTLVLKLIEEGDSSVGTALVVPFVRSVPPSSVSTPRSHRDWGNFIDRESRELYRRG